jgi:hypothetical protein
MHERERRQHQTQKDAHSQGTAEDTHAQHKKGNGAIPYSSSVVGFSALGFAARVFSGSTQFFIQTHARAHTFTHEMKSPQPTNQPNQQINQRANQTTKQPNKMNFNRPGK